MTGRSSLTHVVGCAARSITRRLFADAPGASSASAASDRLAYSVNPRLIPYPPPTSERARLARAGARVNPHLGEDALEPRLGLAVHVRHRRRRRRVHGGDLRMHLVRDGAVAGVTLAARTQLDQLHRLARVQIEDEADPVAQAQRVGGGAWQAGLHQPLVFVRGDLQRAAIVVAAARQLDL